MNTEHKQSINLSPYACAILREDMTMFCPGQTFNGFINDILERYSDDADASFHAAQERQRSHVRRVLDQDASLPEERDRSQLEEFVRLLDREIEATLLEKRRTYDRGRTIIFRLNNRNCRHFFPMDGSAFPDVEYYDGYYSRYFKAVIEEYCQQTRFRREEIYFRSYIETIRQAADTSRILRVTIDSPYSDPGIDCWDVRPYALLPDESHLYHYLVGKSVRAGGLKRDEKTASIRLSRIRSIHMSDRRTGRSGVLTSAEKKEIKKKISNNAVPFLIGDECDVVVRFTGHGRQLFHNTLFMRPFLSNIDSEGDYHFHCTEMHAAQYFIRFGAHAEILAPQALRESMAKVFRDAANVYLR